MRLGLLFVVAALTCTVARSQTVLMHEDFESGFAKWSMTGTWNAQDASEPCSAGRVPFPSGTHCAWFGGGEFCNYWSFTNNDFLTYSLPIALPSTNGAIVLSFKSWTQTENDLTAEWDARFPEVRIVG